MACEKTLGYGSGPCDIATAGMTQLAFMANLRTITAWTAGATGIYTDFTLAPGSGFFQVEIKKDSGRMHETLEGAEESLGSYTQDYEMVLSSLGVEARNFMDDNNGADLVLFVPSKNEEVFILGKDLGCRMVENEADSNSDAYGERAIFRATQMRQKRYFLLDTNYEDTITLLQGKVTAS